ncbi:MAG: Crp/Fnr family transcriptional regulator [Clostridia bacterium]|nr:Crp/Fnr family transcriptional regulator [Clostridia bacterium]
MDTLLIEQMLDAVPLFHGIGKEARDLVISNANSQSVPKGETVRQDRKGELLILLEGEMNVTGMDEHSASLNTLRPGSVFGAATLFGGNGGVSVIRAVRNSLLIALDQKLMTDLVRQSKEFALNYVCFLSDRIRFLNRRIASFTAGSADRKLARYLLSLMDGSGRISLKMSMLRLSSALDMSRASLYRSFESLEEAGLIDRNGRDILITNPQKLTNLYGG